MGSCLGHAPELPVGQGPAGAIGRILHGPSWSSPGPWLCADGAGAGTPRWARLFAPSDGNLLFWNGFDYHTEELFTDCTYAMLSRFRALLRIETQASLCVSCSCGCRRSDLPKRFVRSWLSSQRSCGSELPPLRSHRSSASPPAGLRVLRAGRGCKNKLLTTFLCFSASLDLQIPSSICGHSQGHLHPGVLTALFNSESLPGRPEPAAHLTASF